MSVLETQGGDAFLYHVEVHDPTVPPDPVCCTLENVRPQTHNFELRHNGTHYVLFTHKNPAFAYKDINSYILSVCCEDGFGTVKGLLQINIKEVREHVNYKPPCKKTI